VPTLWRISSYADLSGEGSRLSSARWHTEGRRVVYLAESPAGAIVERLVHLMEVKPDGFLPRTYQLLRISIGVASKIKSLDLPSGIDWKVQEGLTRRIGDTWLDSRETSLARVPSAVAPYTWNYLLNPDHPDAMEARIIEIIREQFDNRLFGFGSR
jgi:RES domain-containing protein